MTLAFCWYSVQRCARQTALDRQNLFCTHLAHHELESVFIVIIIIIIITVIIIIIIIIIVIIIIIIMIIIMIIIVVQGYYDEDMDSEMTESQADEEVAVTKRGRAVKMPAKYKAEVSLCSTARCFSGIILGRDVYHVIEVLADYTVA